MDTQTRHALKKDKFAAATASSVSWLSGHRSDVVRSVVVVVAAVILVAAALIFWNIRSTAADRALGAALDTYSSPLADPGQPVVSGVYSSSADRSKAANQQFLAVAQQYSFMPQAAKAHYFAGVTDQELGQTASAEAELNKAAGTTIWSLWNRDLSNLAKLALAGVYRQTNRDAQAIDIYNALAAKPSETVSTAVAQLDLADLYVTENKQDQARALWAKVKDADKDGAAGSIASQKLGIKQ